MTILICLFEAAQLAAQDKDVKKQLQIEFKGDSRIETGSAFVGAEFHHSSPCPQRISFYYPVANSMDLSSDYWTRDTTFVIKMRLKAGGGYSEDLQSKSFRHIQSPWTVRFIDSNPVRDISIAYEFCKSLPAMVITCEIKNTGAKKQTFELSEVFTRSIKTSHTYKALNPSQTRYVKKDFALVSNYNDIGAGFAESFVLSAGEKPALVFSGIQKYASEGNVSIPDDLLRGIAMPAGYVFRKELDAGEKAGFILIIGTSKNQTGEETASRLAGSFTKDVKDYERSVIDYAGSNGLVQSGDGQLDRSALWARAVLAVNRHYIDGTVCPMPCPAEYNFYFTHDVLMTGLGVVNFDPEQVRGDLRFIAKHASKDSVIPHAYYWKDTAYTTELATPDNWNHFWFIILSARYLRHTADIETLRMLYPYLLKSRSEALKNYRNGLMWAYRPDWWDIGRRFGPRSYMTILFARALQEFSYIAHRLNQDDRLIKESLETAEALKKGLNEKLWDEKKSFLMNDFEDGSRDEHYYMGSLLSVHYGMLEKERAERLLATAESKLLDDKLGIYAVFPMDFHKLLEFWKFAGNEAGDPFFYINGGIWPHANSWYMLALKELNRKNAALSFLKNCMTIDGIIKSPNGQPAMYEYRNGNLYDKKLYGRIDKPQFMWAAGWYLYCLYELSAVSEGVWNISFSPYYASKGKPVSMPISLNGRTARLSISGTGEGIASVKINGKPFPSAVVPERYRNISEVRIRTGNAEEPVLVALNGILEWAEYNDKTLLLEIKGPVGLEESVHVLARTKPSAILLDGQAVQNQAVQNANVSYNNENGRTGSIIRLSHTGRVQKLQLKFSAE